MTELLASTAIASNVGFKVKDVAARIADMDFDAAGNAEKAAWKRYVVYCLMAIAKGEEKAAVVAMVFGKGGKASKTFHNAWTLANKCRGHITCNRAWSDILPMGIEEAFTTTIGMLNTHMATLSVAGKNEYDKVCNMSLAEVETKRNAKPSETEEEEKPQSDNGNAESEAQGKAAERAERDIVQEANAALGTASVSELCAVIAACAAKLGNNTLIAVIGEMLAMDGMGHRELSEVTSLIENRKAAIRLVEAKSTVKAKGSLKAA